jgi:hypothetical protein
MSTGNREIERKYLLTALPPRVLTAPAVYIDQGYLPGVRINERSPSKRDGVVDTTGPSSPAWESKSRSRREIDDVSSPRSAAHARTAPKSGALRGA